MVMSMVLMVIIPSSSSSMTVTVTVVVGLFPALTHDFKFPNNNKGRRRSLLFGLALGGDCRGETREDQDEVRMKSQLSLSSEYYEMSIR